MWFDDPIRFGCEMLAFPPRYLAFLCEKLSVESRRLSRRSGFIDMGTSSGIGGTGGLSKSGLLVRDPWPPETELARENPDPEALALPFNVGVEPLSKKKDENVDCLRARIASAPPRAWGCEKSSLMSSRAREKRTKRRGFSAMEGSRSSRP
jgi:hypothetical protein